LRESALVVLQDLLEPLGTATRLLLEALSVLTVLYGLLALSRQALSRGRRRRGLPERPSNLARLTFGSWLALALEFQLGADIVATTISPSEANLIQLGVVAVIRTGLNVFLAREIEAEQRWEEETSRRAIARDGSPSASSPASSSPPPR
jgi:uncharacterized membrane protein